MVGISGLDTERNQIGVGAMGAGMGEDNWEPGVGVPLPVVLRVVSEIIDPENDYEGPAYTARLVAQAMRCAGDKNTSNTEEYSDSKVAERYTDLLKNKLLDLRGCDGLVGAVVGAASDALQSDPEAWTDILTVGADGDEEARIKNLTSFFEAEGTVSGVESIRAVVYHPKNRGGR